MFQPFPGAGSLSLDFRGWDRPLDVETPAGRGTLRPWTLAAHLPALAAATGPGEGAPVLDDTAFAEAVLATCWEGPAAEGLDALALWWSAAPGAGGPDAEGWIGLGEHRARLRPWSWLERGRALSRFVSDRGLDVAGYLAAQVQRCVVALEPAGPWEALPAGPVLAAIVELHRPPELPPELARDTLRAARALGWAPGKVLSAPSPEIDLLLRLLDTVEPTRAPSPAPVSGLAAYPDAVVIQIEEG